MAERAEEIVHMQKCDRCDGLFPGPGIGREGKAYCCDMCAQGPKMMLRRPMMKGMPRMLGMTGMLVVAFLLGRYLSKS